MMSSSSTPLVRELRALLEVKERLLRASLQEGTMLPRDDPDFLACFHKTDVAVGECFDPELKERARRILAHIRQFNPFNTSDVEENERVAEVVEDFLCFLRDRIEHLEG